VCALIHTTSAGSMKNLIYSKKKQSSYKRMLDYTYTVRHSFLTHTKNDRILSIFKRANDATFNFIQLGSLSKCSGLMQVHKQQHW